MYIILGANGHVGSAAAQALLDRGEQVTTVVHDAAKADRWRQAGAKVAAIDIHDVDALRDVFRTGSRAFLLNPPAPLGSDVDKEETATARAIAGALDGSGLEKVVVQSTYGAQPGEAIGDLSVLCEFERLVKAGGIPAAINRGAYYMSNWDALVEPAKGGKLPTMYPADLAIPMVAPEDLGKAAARRLVSGTDDVGVRYVEGPDHYSSQDVADAFAKALDNDVEVQSVPRKRWEQAWRDLGFSEPSAKSYARMIEVSVDGGFDMPDDPDRGEVTLEEYITDLVKRS